MDGWCGNGGGYSHIMAPNHTGCTFSNDGGPPFQDRTMLAVGSNHSGGVNVGFLDGSVKFVKDSISLATWGALATKAGGEVISGDSY